MPRVMQIINRFNLGGPTYIVTYLTAYLGAEFETLLIGGMRDATEASSEFIVRNHGIEPIILADMRRELNLPRDWRAYQQIKRIMADFKPDIVHTHASKAGALGRLAAFTLKVPATVHTFHGHIFHAYFGNTKTQIYKTIERTLARKTSCIVATCEKQKEELVYLYNICPPEKVVVIPLGIELRRFRENMEAKRQRFRADFNLGDDEIAVGIIGRLVPIKNHPLFIRSIHWVSQQTQKKMRAFIIGDGEERPRLEAMAVTLQMDIARSDEPGKKALITFCSWIRNMDYAYAGLDIVVLTSKNEGTSITLIEAQAANKPVVSTRVGGIENTVNEGETALLSYSDDGSDVPELILQLVEDAPLRYAMGAKGWSHVKERYGYQRMIANTRRLYQTLLAQDSGV